MNNLEWDRDIHQPFPMGAPPMMTPERIEELAVFARGINPFKQVAQRAIDEINRLREELGVCMDQCEHSTKSRDAALKRLEEAETMLDRICAETLLGGRAHETTVKKACAFLAARPTTTGEKPGAK